MVGRVVAREAPLEEITYICEDSERVVAELPHGVLLPPRPSVEQCFAEKVEWVGREVAGL